MATIYDEERYQKDIEESKPSKDTSKQLARSLSHKQLAYILIAISLWYYMVFIRKSIPRNAGWFFGALILIYVLVLMLRGEESGFVTIEEAWIFLTNQLKDMQYKINNLPKGSITLTPVFSNEIVEWDYKMWHIKVVIKNPISSMERIYIASISTSKPVRFLGFRECLKGFDGDESYVVYKEHRATQWAKELGYLPRVKQR